VEGDGRVGARVRKNGIELALALPGRKDFPRQQSLVPWRDGVPTRSGAKGSHRLSLDLSRQAHAWLRGWARARACARGCTRQGRTSVHTGVKARSVGRYGGGVTMATTRLRRCATVTAQRKESGDQAKAGR
jgi:hypothetical protein